MWDQNIRESSKSSGDSVDNWKNVLSKRMCLANLPRCSFAIFSRKILPFLIRSSASIESWIAQSPFSHLTRSSGRRLFPSRIRRRDGGGRTIGATESKANDTFRRRLSIRSSSARALSISSCFLASLASSVSSTLATEMELLGRFRNSKRAYQQWWSHCP